MPESNQQVDAVGATTLQSKKASWAHLGGTLYRPKWMGGGAMIKSVGHARGKLVGRYVRAGGKALGEFKPIARAVQSSGVSTMDVSAKERIYEALYNWTGDIDLDIRLQLCGHTDDPTNWLMIKRLCCCMMTDLSTSGETITTANDDGETIISATMNSNLVPFVIYRIASKVLRLYDEEEFADYEYSNVVVGSGFENGYYLPAIEGIYSMYSLVYWDHENNGSKGSSLLPHEPVDIDSDNNVVMVVLSDGSVYWSNDYGRTLYKSTGVENGVVVSVYSHNNILVGCSSGVYSDYEGVYRSTDGGRTFSNVDPYHSADSAIVAVRHHDNKLAYAVCDTGTVIMSDDGCETFIRLGTSPVTYPKDMIILDGMIIVGGFDGAGAPVIYGTDDGSTWQRLLYIKSGSIFTGSFTISPMVKLASCGCGVVVASITYNDAVHNLQHSEVYRNVNWGVAGCWEPIWEDYRSLDDVNGLMFLTDIECTSTNDVMAVGRILGDDPLFFGVRFNSKEVIYGKEW